MREVIMKTIDAGPYGVRHPGKKYSVPKTEADDLVRGGFAVYATICPTETAVIKHSESAVIEAPEKAEYRPQKGKGKK